MVNDAAAGVTFSRCSRLRGMNQGVHRFTYHTKHFHPSIPCLMMKKKIRLEIISRPKAPMLPPEILPRCSKAVKCNAQQCSDMLNNVQQCSVILNNAQRCSLTLQRDSKRIVHNSQCILQRANAFPPPSHPPNQRVRGSSRFLGA